LAVLADLKAKEGDLTKAQELYDQAADATESLLANSPNEQIKSSLIATMSDIYKGDFAMAAKLGHTAEAFRIVATARGRSIASSGPTASRQRSSSLVLHSVMGCEFRRRSFDRSRGGGRSRATLRSKCRFHQPTGENPGPPVVATVPKPNPREAGSVRFQKKGAAEPRDLPRATRFFAAPRMA
jgi:hypothetical protein